MNNKNQEDIVIPFRVSARTARLIGRENVATSKGAIIELVKNGYDADSKICIVYFDNYYSTIHNEISISYFNELIKKGISVSDLNSLYLKNEEENIFVLKEDINEDIKLKFKKIISKFTSLYIIDAGEGMTQKIIREHWMTIGTDNKQYDFFTRTGRVKAGAKGIGRFALDKLGSKCEMITVFNPEYHELDVDVDGTKTDFNGYRWVVDWEDFEGDFKTIENVGAKLFGLRTQSLKEFIVPYLSDELLEQNEINENFEFGTILKISDLRDNWEDYFVQQVYTDLEVLVPPKESGGFEIYLFSSLSPDKYGEVFGSLCDDFDYKIIAVADEKQKVKIKIIRQEYDVELIPSDFFKRNNMGQFPYTKDDFSRGYWEVEKTFSELLPGFNKVDEDNIFNEIGIFEFSFYFLKRSFSTPDANRFFYRKFQSNFRRDWLDKFGGVKLFRDNFRVRPYGEVKDVAFDWLSLGNRKAASPAGVAKEEGGYRVEPENVAGAIKISRLTNLNFEDKSSREGLQENKTFQIFKALIASIINVFENDRAYIAREMAAFDNERFSEIRTREEAERIAKKILKESRDRKTNQASSNNNSNDDTKNAPVEDIKDQQLAIIAELNEKKDEEIEKLKEEQKVLRGLASSGIVLASFSHDLSKLNNVLDSRVEKLKGLMLEKISENEYLNIDDRKNPFIQLENIKKQDLKLKNWLNFSIGAARKDKRTRKQLFLKKYFSDFKSDWTSVFENRAIQFDNTEIEDIDMRVFEIDFDSIFNNLLVNSIDAFTLSKVNRERMIKVKVSSSQKEIIIDYLDNGPGLSADIDKPEKIFEPLFTTRRNAFSGEEEGTGLGMWLVKSIIEENDGNIKLLYPEIGFGVRLSFPIKFKK